MCKVSIVVPVFNVEKYLVQCMDSLVNQTLQEIEIICVNDGSTDGSLKILKEYADSDPRVRIIDKVNEGYGKSMNRGFDCAAGEYIGIVEPDDYVDLEMFRYLYHTCKQYDLDFVKSDFYRFTTDDGVERLYYNSLSRDPEDYNTVFDPSQKPLALRWIMNTWCGLYKRSFIKDNHIRHNETPGASFQDNGFCFQTFAFGKRAMILDKPFYRNRRDNPNSSVASRQKVFCVNAEYDFIKKILVRDPAVWERFRGVYWQKRYHNYVATVLRISDEFQGEYNNRVRKELIWGLKKGEITKDAFPMNEWIDLNRIVIGEKMVDFLKPGPDNGEKDRVREAGRKFRRWKKLFFWFLYKYGLKEAVGMIVYKIRH